MKQDTLWLVIGTLLLLIAGIIFVPHAHSKVVVALPLITAEVCLVLSIRDTSKKH